jgi:flagellar assembly factor FliW
MGFKTRVKNWFMRTIEQKFSYSLSLSLFSSIKKFMLQKAQSTVFPRIIKQHPPLKNPSVFVSNPGPTFSRDCRQDITSETRSRYKV